MNGPDAMLTAEAVIQTEHPDRYLIQLCNHVSKLGGHQRHRPRPHNGHAAPPDMHAEWTSTDGVVSLAWGRWTMHAGPGTLTLRAEAADQENLRRIQDLVTARLEKIGRRDQLIVSWRQGPEWKLR
jgi:hypothetical protein